MALHRKVIANRTLRPAGHPALRVACAAIRVGAAARLAEYWAAVIPAVSGRLGVCAGTAVLARDQRERFVQFRAGARTGSGAVAARRLYRPFPAGK